MKANLSGFEAGLSSSKKQFFLGTHRTASPRETLERITPHLKACGITRVANVTGLDYIGIPVVMVVRPNSRGVSVAQGKGASLDAAKVSGLMEAIETFHAERIQENLRFGTLRDLQNDLCIAKVAELPQRPGSRFHPDIPMLWIEGKRLKEQSPVWVPYNVVHTNYTLPSPPGSGIFAETSNGLASGNHLYEAICHGICELIERDAVSLKYLSFSEGDEPVQRSECRVDLSTIDDPLCRDVLECYSRARIAVDVLDFTSDIGVPVFECNIREQKGNHFRSLYPTVGWGCHPSRQVALMRALTEAAQSRLTLIAGSRDDAHRNNYRQYGVNSEFPNSKTKTGRNETAGVRFEQISTVNNGSLEEEMHHLERSLRIAGLDEIIVIDLTKQDLAIPVVRVIVPGLEGIGPGTGLIGLYRKGRRAQSLQSRKRVPA